MKKHYRHFTYLIAESPKKLYYITTKGEAFSKDKLTSEITKLNPNVKKGKLRLCIKVAKNPYLTHAVWFIVTGHWPTRNENVIPIDGNELNCNIENLKLVDKREVAKLTGPMSRSQKVIIQNGKSSPKEYSSVRKAAQALYVSYQTLLDYLNGKYKSSVLNKRGRKIYLK